MLKKSHRFNLITNTEFHKNTNIIKEGHHLYHVTSHNFMPDFGPSHLLHATIEN